MPLADLIKRTTYGELTKLLASHRQTLAVYEYLHTHLDSEFLSRDGSGPQKTMMVDGSGEDVPEYIIEDVLESLGTGPILDLKKKIEAIEKQNVVLQEGTSEDGHKGSTGESADQRPRKVTARRPPKPV